MVMRTCLWMATEASATFFNEAPSVHQPLSLNGGNVSLSLHASGPSVPEVHASVTTGMSILHCFLHTPRCCGRSFGGIDDPFLEQRPDHLNKFLRDLWNCRVDGLLQSVILQLLLWNALLDFTCGTEPSTPFVAFDEHLGIPLFGTLAPSGPGHQHQILGAAFSNWTHRVASTTHWHPLFPEAPHLVRRVVVSSKHLHLVAKDLLQQRQLFELRFQVLQVFQVPFVTKIQTHRISSTVARHAQTRWTSRQFLRNSRGRVKGK